MWRKLLRIVGFLLAVAMVVAYICYASHLAKEHRSQQRIETVVISMSDSTATQQFSSSADIREQLKRGGVSTEGLAVDSVDAVKISHYIARNGFVSRAEVYTTYSGAIHINIHQHKPVLRLLCSGYNSYVTAEGEVFCAPKGSAYYIPVVTGDYRPLFAPNFEGNTKDNLARLIAVEEERLAALTEEFVKVNKDYNACRERRAALRKAAKRKKIGESSEEYKMRKMGINVEVDRCNAELSSLTSQKESLEKRQHLIGEQKKKLHKEYDDFANLINFVSQIGDNSFWSAEVVQYVASRNSMGDITLRLIPRSGDFVVEFGELANRDAKLAKLQRFYDKGLSHIGWSQYSVVDVRFDKQVICTE